MTDPEIAPRTCPDAGRVSLSAHGFDVDINPRSGGRIDRAYFQGRDILQPRLAIDDPDPLDAGCFPLVPFSNRIRNGHFSFDGATYDLSPNWTGDEHVIHGEGWQRPWQVVHARPDTVTLAMESDGWWPWPFACRQIIKIRPGLLELSLILTNNSDSIMPAGLGFHPYFPRTSGTKLRFEADAVWAPMGKGSMSAAPLSDMNDFHESKPLDRLKLDHCFQNWRGSALIEHPDGTLPSLLVHSQQARRHCVVFVSEGKDHFCFEPVSHLTGAFELDAGIPTGLVHLSPGEQLDFSMQIEVV